MVNLKYILLFYIAVLVAAHPTNVEIIGGHVAAIEDHPWMVAAYYQTNRRILEFFCSGFLISPTWVVTAGHCTVIPLYAIRAGSNSSDIQGHNNDATLISNSILHPDYKETIDNNPINDIALLNLSTPINLPMYAPIGLPEPFAVTKPGDKINVTGWGLIDNGESSDLLHSVELSVITLDECIDQFRGSSLFINETFCGGNDKNSFKGFCNGDSGGPADMNGVAVGITSWTMHGCADYGFPLVFTNFSNYRNWIHEVTGL